LRSRNGFCLALALLAVVAVASAAQAPSELHDTSAASVASYALSQSMPIDPEALIGTLPNGLRYYVRANAKPAHRAELRLVVKAGSVLEDDDQQGLAHSSNTWSSGTGISQQGLVDFLSRSVSASVRCERGTSYDDTQYTLRIPTDRPDILDRALLS
jgi:zinc protease